MLNDEILEYASRLKVLYVEDHKDTRDAMIMILEDTFGEVCVAVNGQDGLQKFEEGGFSLIISDINMPKMNGIEMLKIIREKDKKTPILVLSAHSDPSYFVDTIHIGIEGYLLKPIEIEQFDYMVSKTIDKMILETERQHYEEELRVSNIELEAATKAKDMFLANMSHEIRTPMNAIIGLSQILLDTKLDKKQTDYVDKIHTSGNLLLGIINDILDFSKIEAGKLDIECIDFNINTVLSNVSNIVSSKAKEKGLELVFDIDDKLPMTFRGDPIRLGQIIINLMNNAVKFTDKGEISLKVTAGEVSDTKEIVLFEVVDSGIGMTEEQVEKLFQAFTQADSSTSRKYGGTGLGLSISKQLVELMGGHIKVESEYGRGSKFSFSIEFETIEDRDNRKFRLPSHSLMNKNVLIINTNTHTSKVLSEILEYFRYKSLAATSMESAKALIENNDFDIIYIEQEILQHSQAMILPRNSDVKIVMLESGFNFEENEQYNGVVIDARLEKPFNQEMVFNGILDLFTEEKHQEQTLQSNRNDLSLARGTTLLLAEDNMINQTVILGLLEDTGINIIIANNGQEAVDMLEKNPQISLILMDVNMPVMGGYEATKIIQEDLKNKDIPIIALTANAMQKDIDAAINAGMQAHLAKPIDVDEFRALLLKYLVNDINENKTLVEKKSELVNTYSILNIEDGIENMGSNKSLYIIILNDFKEKYKNISFELGNAYKNHDYKTGEMLAHDLKSVSGTIGAKKLYESATVLEEAFKNQTIDTKLLYEIVKDYKLLIAEVEQYLLLTDLV